MNNNNLLLENNELETDNIIVEQTTNEKILDFFNTFKLYINYILTSIYKSRTVYQNRLYLILLENYEIVLDTLIYVIQNN